MTSYPTPEFRRTALVPGILAAIVLIAGAVLVGTDGFTWIRFAVSILALIVAVFAWQARHWWWLIGLVPIAIVWNPVWPFEFDGPIWQGAQFAAALIFILAAILVKIVNVDDRNAARARITPRRF